ncbi:DnaQ-like DNA polymerase III subunit [Streptomyces phage Zuko]|uniref:RNaseE n=1 Tax=Streptomyces phage Zuko TaxID=2601695 RepID=A0A5J6D815_9CAUD|nr:Rnase H [Streptomyces phage Zuko]QEQ93615.1 DnaQ-like DNA polymerase III subunit [Streptomyces phage Zuko]
MTTTPNVYATLLEPDKPWFVTYDFEFLDDGDTIMLVSGGFKSGDGRRLYFVNREMDQKRVVAHDWMRKNVWPHLPLKDLPETSGDMGQYKKKTCRCASQVKDKKHEWTCLCMNGRLDMDHPDVRPMGQIRRLISDFLLESHPEGPDMHRDNIKMWAWYGAYDHVRLAQCFGPMISLPDHVPMLTHDLKSEAMRLGNPTMPKQKGKEHNALADAEGNHLKARFLWGLATDNPYE